MMYRTWLFLATLPLRLIPIGWFIYEIKRRYSTFIVFVAENEEIVEIKGGKHDGAKNYEISARVHWQGMSRPLGQAMKYLEQEMVIAFEEKNINKPTRDGDRL